MAAKREKEKDRNIVAAAFAGAVLVGGSLFALNSLDGSELDKQVIAGVSGNGDGSVFSTQPSVGSSVAKKDFEPSEIDNRDFEFIMTRMDTGEDCLNAAFNVRSNPSAFGIDRSDLASGLTLACGSDLRNDNDFKIKFDLSGDYTAINYKDGDVVEVSASSKVDLARGIEDELGVNLSEHPSAFSFSRYDLSGASSEVKRLASEQDVMQYNAVLDWYEKPKAAPSGPLVS